MPKKVSLGNAQFIVDVHRGNAIAKIAGRKSERIEAGLDPCLRSPPPPGGVKAAAPRVQFHKVTEATQFPDTRSQERKITGMMPFSDPDAAYAAVDAHITRRLNELLGDDPELHKPLIFMIAEDHRRRTSLVVYIAALASLKRHLSTTPALAGRPPAVVLMEHPAATVRAINRDARDFVGVGLAQAAQLPVADASKAMEDLLELRVPGQADDRRANNRVVKAYVAQQAEMQVRSFDELHRDASDRVHRESGMLHSVYNALMNNTADGRMSPVVVNMGSAHLATVHRYFESTSHVVAISAVFPPTENEQFRLRHKREAQSYVLAHPDIMEYRPSPAIDLREFNFAQFAANKGIPMPGVKSQSPGRA